MSGRAVMVGVVVVALASCGTTGGADGSRACIEDRGPAALVAVDRASGDVLWTQLVGDVFDIDASGDVLAVVSTNGTAVGLNAKCRDLPNGVSGDVARRTRSAEQRPACS